METPVYKARVDLDLNLIPNVAAATHAGQPQAAAPVNGGRVDYPAKVDSGNNRATVALLVVLVFLTAAFFGFALYKHFSAASAAERFSDVPKNEDRPAVVDSRPAAEAPQPVARDNPEKEKYLADCAAAGAPVIQTASGMRCTRPSSVTVHSGQLPPALANARTLAEYKQACAAAGARYWTEPNGKPRCTK